MIQFKMTVYSLRVDRQKFKEALSAHIKSSIEEALRAFILAAVPKVPIYTGFARSAYKNLEDEVNAKVTTSRGRDVLRRGRGGGNLNRQTARGKPRNKPIFYKHTDGSQTLKTTDSGRKFATPNDPEAGTYILQKNSAAGWTVQFGVTITYFDFLDRQKWGSIKAGQNAFNERLKELLNTDPPVPAQFITRRLSAKVD